MNGEAETRAEQRKDPLVGRTFDGYRVDGVVGRGGMGVVYRAQQLSLNRPVALKVLPKEFTDRPQFLERFHREVDVLSRLAHPSIVTVLERGEVDGSPYLAMEFVEGTSLRDVIKQGPLPRSEALAIVRSVLGALEHAHDKGIIHRDIKPENVLLAKGGIVKVADFGLGRLIDPQETTRLTHTALMLGTFEYMSPEQREKAKQADERSDIYATGVILYEMLAGELPIGAFEPLSQKRPDECDARIDELVKRSLDKSPEKRFQRASEMGEAVSRLLTAAPEEAPDAPAPQPAPVEKEKEEKKHEIDLQGYVAIGASLVGVLIAAWMEFDLGVFGWTVWGVGIAAAIVLLPPLINALWAMMGWLMGFGAAMLPIVFFVGWSFLGDDEHEFDALRIQGDLPADFETRVLEDPKAQSWVKATALPDVTWPEFPKGIDFKRDDGKIVIEIDEDTLRDRVTAGKVATAIALVLEASSGGRAKRIITGDTFFESELVAAPKVDWEEK